MKKNLLSAVLTAGFVGFSLPAMAVPVSAEIIGSGECGENLTWTLDDSGTLTISGEGEMWDYGSDDPPWYPLIFEMTYTPDAQGKDWVWNGTEIHIIIEDDVTSIGNWAFSELGAGVTAVSLPESLLYIGEAAFYFDWKLMIEEIPSNVIAIGDSAFWGSCANEEIIFPESLQSIGEEAFYACDNLKSVTILNPNCAFPMWTDEETGETGYNIVFTRYEYIEFDEFTGSGVDNIFDGTIYGYTNSTAQAYTEYMIANDDGYSNASFVALDAAEPETTPATTSDTIITTSYSTTTAPAPPQTGDTGIALALAGLLTAAGAAFVLRKKD